MAASRIRDYRTVLRRRKVKRTPIVRTVKHPGDVEIVYRDGEYRVHRYGEVAA